MKKIILLFLTLLPASVFGQADTTYPIGVEDAQYKGGREAMVKFINKTLVYPADAVKNKIEGQVIIAFDITSEGHVVRVHVVKGIHELLDREALRVINQMPPWIPEKINGRPVLSKFSIPINFKL